MAGQEREERPRFNAGKQAAERTSADHIGGDKIAGHKAGRDVITVSNVSSSYIAIGDGAQNIVQHIQQTTSAIDELEKGIQAAERLLANSIQTKISRYAGLSERIPSKARTNPYKALLDYQLEDAPFFYGRAAAIQAMNQRLARGRLTVLHSESGSGKSSLLQAGLAARLLAEGHFPLYVRPYQLRPDQAIRRNFLPDYARQPELSRFNDDQMSLRGFLERVTHYLGDRILYVFLDQFEEFFTELRPQDQERFNTELQACVDSDLPVWWVFSVRKEYFSDLRLFQALKPFDNEYFLPSFRPDEAKEVVVEPAAIQGVSFETGLVDAILADLSDGEKGIQPAQVQLVCYTLFEELPSEQNEIGRVIYEQPRGRGAGEPGAAGILTSHLSRVLDQELKGRERKVANRVLEALVTSEQRRVRRDLESLIGELGEVPPDQLDRVLETLYENRLVRREMDKEDRPVYELTHDYLLGEIELDPETRARKAAQEILDQEVANWRANRRLRVPADKLDVIEAQGEQLVWSAEARELLDLSRQALQRQRRLVFAGGGVVAVLLVAAVALVIVALGAQGAARAAQEEIATATVELAAADARQTRAAAEVAEATAQLATAEIKQTRAAHELAVAGSQQAAAEATLDAIGREAASISLAIQSIDAVDPEEALYYAIQAFESLGPDQAVNLQTHRALLRSIDNPLRMVFAHEDQVSDISLSADGKVVLTGSLDGTARLWSLENGQHLYTFRHDDIQGYTTGTRPASIRSVALTANGSMVLTGSDDGTARLWSAESGKVIHTFEHTWHAEVEGYSFDLPDRVNVVAVSPDGAYALTGTLGGAVKLWSLDTGQLVHDMELNAEVNDLAFSPDGTMALAGSAGGMVRLWSVETGEAIHTLDHNLMIQAVAFSPDGELALLGSGVHDIGVGEALLWSLETGNVIRTFEHEDRSPSIRDVAFSPDGTLALTAAVDGSVNLWSVESGEVLLTLDHEDDVYEVAFSPDGKLALTGSGDLSAGSGAARLWSLETGDLLKTMEHKGTVVSVAFSPHGSWAVTGSHDGTARLWTLTEGPEYRTLGYPFPVNSAVFSPDGKLALTGQGDSAAHIWSVDSGQELYELEHDDTLVYSVAFSPNGELALTGGWDDTARLWSVQTGEELFVLAHDEYVRDVTFSPDGSLALTGDGAGNAQLWSVETGQLLQRFEHDALVTVVAFSPDGQRALTGAGDGAARLWSVETGEELHRLEHEGLFDTGVSAVAFSPDGTLIVSGSTESRTLLGEARVWSAANGELLHTFAHEAGVTAVAFSPDGTLILTGSSDKTVQVWEAKTGQALHTLAHAGPIKSMALSPDGAMVLVGADAAYLWSLETGQLLHKYELGYGLDQIEFSPNGELALLTTNSGAVILLLEPSQLIEQAMLRIRAEYRERFSIP